MRLPRWFLVFAARVVASACTGTTCIIDCKLQDYRQAFCILSRFGIAPFGEVDGNVRQSLKSTSRRRRRRRRRKRAS
jgi:hypothetical protein